MKTEKYYVIWCRHYRSKEYDTLADAKRYADKYMRNSKVASGDDIIIVTTDYKPVIASRWRREQHAKWEDMDENEQII